MYEIEQVVLQSRPGKTNPPSEENFAYAKAPPIESQPIECKDGEIVAKTLYLSVDPYMRGRMNDHIGTTLSHLSSYIEPWSLGEPLSGGGVGVVVESKCDGFVKGDIVQAPFPGFWPWQNNVLFPSEVELTKVDNAYLKEHPSLLLGLCGLTGVTSLIGLEVKGHIVPGKNQTVVVSGAAGACGVAAGQIAKLLGSGKVVGTCGTDEKCQYIRELGFDAAINYKTTTDMRSALKSHCPDGIDVYFDNVGGTISEEVIRLMNKDSHVVVCGQISSYNKDIPFPNPLSPEVQEIATKQNVTRELFLVLRYNDRVPEAMQKLTQWVQEGKLKSRETVAVGLENTGKAFVSMMNGGNIGKQIVKVSDH
ncbi:prostaglandin reductase 2 [Exaiptasia diaphana]|uniref:15-oxoprostaglandin 13-reductase n=1 Tax=Exaiptasia diaphana TaxID=2652724 RepID=A0A913WW89_EXADI|nr:prostaglandin reductase 2 [Exaiptasia diaphana]